MAYPKHIGKTKIYALVYFSEASNKIIYLANPDKKITRKHIKHEKISKVKLKTSFELLFLYLFNEKGPQAV